MNALLIILSSATKAAEHAAKKVGEHGDTHTVEHGAEHASTGVFPPLDPSTFTSQLFWLFLTFGVLLFMLSKVLLPRLAGVLEERSNRIADDLDSAARMQREAEAAESAYEQALKDARAKAHNVAETTRASINAEIEAETATADADAAHHLELAESKINKYREAAMANVDDIAADTARSLVEKLFSGKITAAAAAKAVKAQH